MWTAENRPRYNRDKLRYPSDLTDEEWTLIAPLIPPGKSGGGKRTVDLREVVNGLMYILSTGCQWRALPKDLPPRSTVHDYLGLWSWDGTLDRIHQKSKKSEKKGDIHIFSVIRAVSAAGREDGAWNPIQDVARFVAPIAHRQTARRDLRCCGASPTPPPFARC